MAQYTVTGKGELKKAGSYLKQILTVLKADGTEVECFTWVGDEESAADIHVGDVLEGELSYKDSPNPKYKGEWKLGKWTKVSGASAVKPESQAPKVFKPAQADETQLQIRRGNACNAICSMHSGKAIDIADLYAEIRQMNIYITTGYIPLMSTKTQHEAILAMFTKEENGKRVPDLEAAHEELMKATGIPYIRALTMDEAAAFLASMTPDSL